jgi:hypothetical protein
MKKLIPVLVAVLLPTLAYCWSINPEGTSGAPVAVSTASVEVAPCAQRSSIEICNQGTQSANTVGSNMMFCATGPTGINATGLICGASGTGGTFAPTAAGAGFFVLGGQCQTFNSPDNVSWNGIQAEYDCICAVTTGCEAYVVTGP